LGDGQLVVELLLEAVFSHLGEASLFARNLLTVVGVIQSCASGITPNTTAVISSVGRVLGVANQLIPEWAQWSVLVEAVSIAAIVQATVRSEFLVLGHIAHRVNFLGAGIVVDAEVGDQRDIKRNLWRGLSLC